ncbi:MAG: ABC transporter permease [Nocardioides sp.]|uniref:ABC transporter permease n=1 Tax=Nocardioides sp. TaxID=35761 RepID=UPI0039E3BE7E
MPVTLLAISPGPSCYSRLVNDWVCPAYWRDRGAEIREATVQHLEITVLALLLGLVVAVPLALVARRLGWLRTGVLGLTTALYTIPSLALLPLLVPFTGLTMTTVVIGLAAYALTILVRAVVDGLDSVPAEVRDAAVGLGYGPARRLLRIELPLASPVILAGLRVAAVSTVALTTIGSLVSYGGLGNLIADGVRTDFRAELLTAAVLCVVLALLLDLILVGCGRMLTRWRR